MSQTSEKSLFKNRSFLLMWSSVAASGFGDRMIMLSTFALLGGLAATTGGTSINAGVYFFFFLPYILFTIPAGKLADKLPRKWLMLFCDEMRAALFLLGFYMIPDGKTIERVSEAQEWEVYGIVALIGVFAAIFQPTKSAALPEFVPNKQLQSANALIGVIAVIASLAGQVIGGAIIAVEGDTKFVILDTVKTTLWMGFAFFAVSGLFFAFLKPIHEKKVETAKKVVNRKQPKALPYILKHQSIMLTIFNISAVWGIAMIVNAAAVGLCKTLYEVSTEELMSKYTVFGACLGAGMLVAAITIAVFNTRKESTNIAIASLFATGFSCLLLGLVPIYSVGLFLAFCVGFFGNITIINLTTFLQVISPNYMRGRVMGTAAFFEMMAIVATNFIVWRMPNSDIIIVTVLQVMAVLIMVATSVILMKIW